MKPKKLTVLDGVLGLLILLFGFYIFYRIRVGLDYRWNWSIIPQYLIRYDSEKQIYVPNLLLNGFFTTLRLSLWGTIFAVMIGGFIGVLRITSNPLNRLIGWIYVEVIRNLPPLVLIFIFYYFASEQIMPILCLDRLAETSSEPLRRTLTLFFAPPARLPNFFSALLTLSLFEGAYIAEIVRAGVQSIEKGQWEASAALGFTWFEQMRHIIGPQAIQRILPPLAGQLISTIKDSAIVSVISIPELTFQGMQLMSSTYLAFEVWITITILYLVLTLSCSFAVNRFENYLREKQKRKKRYSS